MVFYYTLLVKQQGWRVVNITPKFAQWKEQL